MSDGEAAALLGVRSGETSELVALAKGWPAVLALAAVFDEAPPDLMGAPHLHSFFADEIYRRLDRKTRQRLAELALYGIEGRQLAITTNADRPRPTCCRDGYLLRLSHRKDDGRLDVHPLVRTFLLLKLREERPRALAGIVDRAVRTLLKHRLWDEAFSLIEQFGRDDLLVALVEASLEELLASGRAATLANWVRDSTATAPVIRLATAEVAFREGRFYESEALAALAANDSDTEPELAAKSSFVAGRAAHVASRETQARSYYARARDLTTDPQRTRQAAFGELVAMIELEDPTAEAVLATLADETPLDPSEQVLLADRRLVYETRFGAPVDLQERPRRQPAAAFRHRSSR